MNYREFRFVRKGKADLLWMIAQDGNSLHTKHGQVGGAMQEFSDIPGSKGVADTKAFVNEVDNCTFHVNREIRKKTEAGYIEYVDGLPTEEQVTSLSFDKYLPKNFCGYKPQTSITDKALAALSKKKKDRYTRKYDGMCHLLVHHDHGWEIYTRRMDLTTDRFPNHIKKLESFIQFGVGTIIVGEMACFKPDGTDDFKAISRICRSKPDDARLLVEDDEVHEPLFIIFDLLYLNGTALNDKTYDERAFFWKNISNLETALNYELKVSARPFYDSKFVITSVDYYDVTPSTWEAFAKSRGWEGFVVTDGDAKPGDKFFSFNGKAKRPKGSHKLKPIYEEDVVIYAGFSGTGKRLGGVGSVFVKQKHPDTGKWFRCGKVGSGFTDEDLDEIQKLFEEHDLPIFPRDKEAEMLNIDNDNGLVMEMEYSERQPGTNKFRFPVFVRLRDDKGVAECEAQRMAPEE
jgi:ATP-dependent DNA ligase